MTAFLVIGAIMGIVSAIFWVLESKPFFDKVKSLKAPQGNNPFSIALQSSQYLVGFIQATISLWRLALDVLCTVWLTGAFGLGGSVTGSIIGLSISNVISIFLLFQGKKE